MMVTSPLVGVASRAALYPIQSIIIIALLVSGAYFHLLDIARNPPPSTVPSTTVAVPRVPVQSTIWARKQNDVWKWTVDPVKADKVWIRLLGLLMDRDIIWSLRGDRLASRTRLLKNPS
jgi:hypothetical protein